MSVAPISSIRYFRADEAHLEMVVQLRLDVLAVFQGSQPPEVIESLRPQLRNTMLRGLSDEHYICWLAEADGIIAGSGGMSIRQQPGNFTNPSGRTGYIMSMYTVPEYRGRGICSELVKHLLQSGRALGITSFELHATKAGEPVYQKLGFLLHDEPTYRKQE